MKSPKPFGLLKKTKKTHNKVTIWRDNNGFPKRFATKKELLDFAMPRLLAGKVFDFRIVSYKSVKATINP